MAEKILVIGSCGQLGTELVESLRGIYGTDNVVASDIRKSDDEVFKNGPFETLDVLDKATLGDILNKYKPSQIYHLAALLSATAEAKPKLGWSLNMDGLFNVLDAAIEHKTGKIYWPSSIAVFGPNTPRVNTPQNCVMDPSTIYGISKLAGERYCEYYFKKHGVDIRSLRYPGLIGYKSEPGGGTTDYAVSIYHDALKTGVHNCFLSENTVLPMLYMPDALKATLDIMHAPAEKVKIRSSYNLAGMSFSPKEITASIQKHIPEFKTEYNPDSRQAIADSWPQSINDAEARADWGWKNDFNLDAMTADMLKNLAPVYGKQPL
ncbi:MAG: NAD-dependent epimerase/dehydratase family protein [Bacteroidia bacterium]|nr:NAD-dependent epimerase/dehydratase family protein [Bacteroidia bacterium]